MTNEEDKNPTKDQDTHINLKGEGQSSFLRYNQHINHSIKCISESHIHSPYTFLSCELQYASFQNNWPSVMFAMAGGVVLSLGNLSTQYAWAFIGLSVNEVITASITVVIGTTLNYFLDDKINRAEILFLRVSCFLIVMCLGSIVYAKT
ncbi:hypothetical protein Lser_V15G25211 [Lactuca serriola]